jgi:hypothetical protein
MATFSLMKGHARPANVFAAQARAPLRRSSLAAAGWAGRDHRQHASDPPALSSSGTRIGTGPLASDSYRHRATISTEGVAQPDDLAA